MGKKNSNCSDDLPQKMLLWADEHQLPTDHELRKEAYRLIITLAQESITSHNKRCAQDRARSIWKKILLNFENNNRHGKRAL